MERAEYPDRLPDCIPGELLVTFKSIMDPKSRTELLKSIGATLEKITEDRASVIITVPEGTESDVLKILQGAAGIQGATRIMRAGPLQDRASED